MAPEDQQRARRTERFLRLADAGPGPAEAEAADRLGDAAVALLEGSPEGIAILVVGALLPPISVCTQPGCMTIAVMPLGARSSARLLVTMFKAVLLER